MPLKDAEGKGGGVGKVHGNKGSYLSFGATRAIVQKLKLGSKNEWQAWSKSG